MTIITDPGLGAPPSVEQRALAPAIVDSLTVVNVAIGGQFTLDARGSWKIHGGYQTDRSPVGSNDSQFTKVDMQAWTVGVSGRTSFFLGSVGLRYEPGNSDPFVFRALQGGQVVQTPFRISNLRLVYSVSFKF